MRKLFQRMHARWDKVLFAFVPLAEYPASSRLGGIYQGTDLSRFVSDAFKAAISIGAILAVLRLAYAGYLYMGSDMWTSKGKAREVIGDVVLGILILLSVYLILNQINPDLLKLDVLRRITPVQQQTTPGGGGGGGSGAPGEQGGTGESIFGGAP